MSYDHLNPDRCPILRFGGVTEMGQVQNARPFKNDPS